jgi:hypothetical protein
MITVLYAKSNSINPSYTVLYAEMSRRIESDLRVIDVSSASIAQIEQQCRTSDLVVVDNFIRVANALNPTVLSSVMLSNWRGQDFYDSVWHVAITAGAPVLYVASGWDLHWPGPDLEQLLPKLSGIAWLYERRPVSLLEVPVAFRDTWMAGQSDPIKNWERIRSNVKTRIELLHSLDAGEFENKIASPSWDVCVAGDTYMPRVLARRAALDCGMKEAPIRFTDTAILRLTGKLPLLCGNLIASSLRNRWRQANQRFLTHRSAINFVCGSGYRYPVRKFFEIPAARSAMLAYPCSGMRDYGFVDGEHYLQIAPEYFGREAQKLLANKFLRSKLIDNAWQMVSRLHSTERRVDDLIECMRRMAAGRLQLATFQEGEFVIE